MADNQVPSYVKFAAEQARNTGKISDELCELVQVGEYTLDEAISQHKINAYTMQIEADTRQIDEAINAVKKADEEVQRARANPDRVRAKKQPRQPAQFATYTVDVVDEAGLEVKRVADKLTRKELIAAYGGENCTDAWRAIANEHGMPVIACNNKTGKMYRVLPGSGRKRQK